MIVTVLALALAFLLLMSAIYAVPIRRTWRMEHDLPLNTPGPHADRYESLGA